MADKLCSPPRRTLPSFRDFPKAGKWKRKLLYLFSAFFLSFPLFSGLFPRMLEFFLSPFSCYFFFLPTKRVHFLFCCVDHYLPLNVLLLHFLLLLLLLLLFLLLFVFGEDLFFPERKSPGSVFIKNCRVISALKPFLLL